MDNDFFLLDVPEYIPQYDSNIKYSYSDTQMKKELLRFLCSVSNGYCMYCYNKIKVNGNIYADLEHGMEKNIAKKILADCIPNIGISCSKCNQKYKRYMEKKRVLYMKKRIVGLDECKNKICNKPCNEMIKLRKEYISNGKILIHPFENYLLEQHKLRLQYDLLNARYIPSQKLAYTEEEKKIIEGHINLFQLNRPQRRNREVPQYCKNVIDQGCLLIGVKYNNYMVELLQQKLRDLNSLEKAIEVCKIIYFMNFIKMAT